MFRKKTFPLLTTFLAAGISLSGMMIILDNETVCGNTEPVLRGALRHIEGSGVGYNRGYTTLEFFLAPLQPFGGAWVPLIDVRGHVFNDAQFAGNIGIGARYLGKRVWGLNLFYDGRGTEHQWYHQLGAGVEVLGKVLDVRLNGYLPVGETEVHYAHGTRKQFALGGLNAELGWKGNKVSDVPIYLAIGPYYFHGKDKNALGGQGRIRVDFLDYLGIEAIFSYDTLFKFNVQGQLSLTIPFGSKQVVKKRSGFSCKRSVWQRNTAIERIMRNEIIVLDQKRVQPPPPPYQPSEQEIQMQKAINMKWDAMQTREASTRRLFGE